MYIIGGEKGTGMSKKPKKDTVVRNMKQCCETKSRLYSYKLVSLHAKWSLERQQSGGCFIATNNRVFIKTRKINRISSKE